MTRFSVLGSKSVIRVRMVAWAGGGFIHGSTTSEEPAKLPKQSLEQPGYDRKETNGWSEVGRWEEDAG
jgi:hypothetical protein